MTTVEINLIGEKFITNDTTKGQNAKNEIKHTIVSMIFLTCLSAVLH